MATKELSLLLRVAMFVLVGFWNAVAQTSGPENGVVLIELPQGRGAGIVLSIRKSTNKNEILVLTAYHVIQGLVQKQKEQVDVRFYGNPARFKADIVDDWIDTSEDLAVIRVVGQSTPTTVRPLQLGNLDSISQRSSVLAIGHRVDGGDEEWLSDDGKVAQPVGLLITFSRTTTDRGFSGGPLLNSNREVVGMVTDVNTSGGLGYAKNANMLRDFLRGKGIDVNSKPQLITFAISGSFQQGYTYSSESKVTLDAATGLAVSANIIIVGPKSKEVFAADPAYDTESMWQWQNQGSLGGSLDLQEKQLTFVGYSGGTLTHAAYWTPTLGHNITSSDTVLRPKESHVAVQTGSASSLTSKNEPNQSVAMPAAVVRDDLSFQVRTCVFKSTTLRCTFGITNKASSTRRLWFTEAFFVDNDGRQHNHLGLEFASKTNWLDHTSDLIPDIPVNLMLDLVNCPDSVNFVSVQISYGVQVHEGQYYAPNSTFGKINIKQIPITR
jgi:hypothetical protein